MCTSEIESEQYVPIKEQFNYINIQRMPSRHSKQISGREVFTASEKSKAGVGTLTQRLGVESQLPFGYCGLTLTPAEEAVVSPSGRIYSREAIIEYLLQKTKEIKELAREYELEQVDLIFYKPLILFAADLATIFQSIHYIMQLQSTAILDNINIGRKADGRLRKNAGGREKSIGTVFCLARC